LSGRRIGLEPLAFAARHHRLDLRERDAIRPSLLHELLHVGHGETDAVAVGGQQRIQLLAWHRQAAAHALDHVLQRTGRELDHLPAARARDRLARAGGGVGHAVARVAQFGSAALAVLPRRRLGRCIGAGQGAEVEVGIGLLQRRQPPSRGPQRAAAALLLQQVPVAAARNHPHAAVAIVQQHGGLKWNRHTF
jgi:hypothetical protein